MSRTVAALLCAALLAALSLAAAQTDVALAPANELAVIDSSSTSSLPEMLESLGVTDAAPFACNYQAPDGKYFDFSSMTTATGTQVPGVSTTEVYMINVSPAGQSYPIANYDATPAGSPPSYSLITPGDSSGGVQLSFANGVVSGSPVQVVMQFKCTADADVKYVAQRDTGSHWTISVSSSKACGSSKKPGGGGDGKKGLSGGWVFIIILLVVSFLYVVGGCVFKRQKQGTQGMESCPNIDFWRGLPGLVKDGCAFFLLQCKNMVARCQGKPTASSAESDYSTFNRPSGKYIFDAVFNNFHGNHDLQLRVPCQCQALINVQCACDAACVATVALYAAAALLGPTATTAVPAAAVSSSHGLLLELMLLVVPSLLYAVELISFPHIKMPRWLERALCVLVPSLLLAICLNQQQNDNPAESAGSIPLSASSSLADPLFGLRLRTSSPAALGSFAATAIAALFGLSLAMERAHDRLWRNYVVPKHLQLH